MFKISQAKISVWNECARLLANCVLYYNAFMLNSWSEQSDREGDAEKSLFIRNLSPVAWTHVNFQGRFYFMSQQEEIDPTFRNKLMNKNPSMIYQGNLI